MTLSTKGKLAAIGIAGALTFAAATPSMAYWRNGHWYGPRQSHWYGPAAVAGGIVAGAALGTAALATGGAYGAGYGPNYAYDPGYAYGPGPGYDAEFAPRSSYYCGQGDYAYVPPPGAGGCFVATDSDRGYGYYGSCAAREQNIDSGSGSLTTDNQAAPR
jgi:hypothetical protein